MIAVDGGNVLSGAKAAADSAAAAAGVETRSLTELSELHALVALFSEVWGRKQNPPITIELLRAFAKAGNYIGGAYDGDVLLGGAVAFSSAGHHVLHSHIAGVSGAARGRNVGFALKLHQRAWAMERGIAEISWTFDPLVSRNAYFNLVKLAAEPVEYLTNFYGGMEDSINGADDTDRLLVRWVLDSAPVIEACAGRMALAAATAARARGAVESLGITAEGDPVLGEIAAGTTLVAVPADIESMRTRNPAAASAWRSALRTALSGLMASGSKVTAFDRSGWYILNSASSGATVDERTTT